MTGLSHPCHIAIRSSHDATIAQLDARSFARDAGLGGAEQTRIATVVAELASNIAKYAGAGRITLAEHHLAGRRYIEIEARDRGPGIACVATAMADHTSTGGTLGLGLPGVRRLVDEFTIESGADSGTTVRARRWLDGR